MGTPNLNLTIPVGGTTPGAANNTTPGTYPFIEAANLNIIDSTCFSPNNPVTTASAGLNINSNVNFNEFGITNVSTGAFSSNLTIGGTLGVTGAATFSAAGTALTVTNNATVSGTLTVATLSVANLSIPGTLAVGGISTFGQGLANTIAIAGKATGTDPTITVAGDATRSLNIVVPSASASTIAGLVISPSAGVPSFIGNQQSNFAALWLGFSDSTATTSNYAVSYDPVVNQCNVQGSTIQFNVGGTVELLVQSTSIVTYLPILEGAAATALTISGNAAATGGVANILDNQTTQTSGTIASFRSGGTEQGKVDWKGMLFIKSGITEASATTPLSLFGTAAATGSIGTILDNTISQTSGTITSFRTGGVEKANVDFTGTFTSGSGKFGTSTASTGVILNGNAAAAGVGLIITNSADVGATGYIAQFNEVATAQFAITGRGHLIPLSTAPATVVWNANFGTTSGTTQTGGDTSFRLNVTAGAGAASIAANALVATVTLNQAFSSTSFGAIANFASVLAAATEGGPLYCVPSAAGTIQIYVLSGFTPVNGHAYTISVLVMAAGATS